MSGRIVSKEGHAKISADMLRTELEKREYDKKFIEACYEAIVFHSGNYNTIDEDTMPKTMEGKVVRDADKVAFVGVGRWEHAIAVDKRFNTILNSIFRVRNESLSLEVSKELWDIRVIELIVFLHNEVFGERD